MKFYTRLLLFAIVNFGGLWIGSILMNNGPQTSWYLNLEKAPWTPPGWVFGAAWFTIMLCFSIYLALLTNKIDLKKILPIFGIQFFLNVSWNYIFFNQHFIELGLLNLILLTIVVIFFSINYYSIMKKSTALLFPYILWLCIANSLNAYILLNN